MFHDDTFEKMFSNMKFIFDATLLVALYFGGVLALNTDLTFILTVVGASAAGAIVLAYFRRDRDHKEIFFKTCCASICGLVTGALITKYYAVESREYVIAVYFFTSLLSLFFIKGLLSVTEQNASGFIISIIQRFANTTPAGNYKILPPDSRDRRGVQSVETTVKVEKEGDAHVIAEKKISEKDK